MSGEYSNLITNGETLNRKELDKNGKSSVRSFFNRMADDYEKRYTEEEIKNKYPANQIRLNIFISVLRNIKPKKVLDVGCGSGKPMVEMLNHGFEVHGFDYAEKMVEEARRNLNKAGYPEELVQANNMEDIRGIKPGDFDCVVALGSIYYARDFNKTVKNIVNLLPLNGHFIFSLRNDLFSLFSINKYTIHFFFKELMPTEMFRDDTKQKIFEFLSGAFSEKDVKHQFETIDDLNIRSVFHNPLTVEKEVLSAFNLRLKGLYFYHFHAMPPIFEHIIPEEFRTVSARLENATDWRGLFMASAFIVHAQKKP